MTAIAAMAVGALALGPAPAWAGSPVDNPVPPVRTPRPVPNPNPPPPPLPAVPVAVSVTPGPGRVVGVAYPITAHFTVRVESRRAAEQNMKVYAGSRLVNGAWYWHDGSTALFRPRTFWPGHSTISVRMSLRGVQLAANSHHRFLGAATTTRVNAFRTARSFIAKVDARTDRMRVYVDGVLARTFGVSLGKPGFETRSGIKAVMEKYLVRHMTSAQLGLTDPKDKYDLMAPYAVRITPSGEFVHGAPWAAGRIGRWNGSHGCTNMLTNDAKWFYDHVVPGDAVVTTGTSRRMEPWNGTGGPWNIPWSEWLAHSALRGQTA